MASIPHELVAPFLIFGGYWLVLLLAVRTFTGDWMAIPAAFVTIFIAGFAQVVIIFGMNTAGVPSMPAWFQGGVLEGTVWIVVLKIMVKTGWYRVVCIALVIEGMTWIFRLLHLEWSLGPVLIGFGKLVGQWMS
jgi:hypothetical protein